VLFERHGHSIINAKNKYGDTPLHAASFRRKLHAIQYLVETAGANIHAVDLKGKTPLHIVAIHNHCHNTLEVVQYLVEVAGANVNAVDVHGRPYTPLHLALQSSWNEKGCINYLLAGTAGAGGIEAVDNNGNTPLHYTTFSGNEAGWTNVKDLVEIGGANIHAVNNKGDTPRHRLRKHGNVKAIRYLVEMAGANIYLVNSKGETPLSLALVQGTYQVVKCLVEICSVDVNAVQYASKYRNVNVVECLVRKCGVDNCAVDANDHTHCCTWPACMAGGKLSNTWWNRRAWTFMMLTIMATLPCTWPVNTASCQL
jgi:ankyrin repeat protein